MAIKVLAPAKINLALHVTGLREDGYHLLDSLVAFADFGDQLTVSKSDEMRIKVTGPFAQGVPTDRRNLCWQAAELFGETVSITLQKNLPHAAGIGGGSSDAAAVLNAMEQLFDRPLTADALSLGADVPVCRHGGATRMRGIGERLDKVDIPPLYAVLVNPRVSVPTSRIFKGLSCKSNPAMTPLPAANPASDFWSWLAEQRNDLETPAIAAAPVIQVALQKLSALNPRIARMSGSGATCFALFDQKGLNEAHCKDLQARHPDWWVRFATLT